MYYYYSSSSISILYEIPAIKIKIQGTPRLLTNNIKKFATKQPFSDFYFSINSAVYILNFAAFTLLCKSIRVSRWKKWL